MQTQSREISVGLYLGEREVEITPELVQQYTQAVQDHNQWYLGTSPFGGAVAPALLLHSQVYRYQGWYLPRVYGNLHAKQEWELFQPLLVGQKVTTRATIVDRYVKRDREYVVNEVTCYGDDGAMLNRGRTHQSFLREDAGGEIVVGKERERSAQRRFEVGEGAVLEEIPSLPKQATLEMCRLFSGPAKNYHTDREEARKLGFPDIVVQGMMSLCFLSEMMTNRFGAGWFTGGRMNVNLVNVLWPLEQITCRGLVRELTPEGSSQRAHLQVWCEKADGTKVTIGTASAVCD